MRPKNAAASGSSFGEKLELCVARWSLCLSNTWARERESLSILAGIEDALAVNQSWRLLVARCDSWDDAAGLAARRTIGTAFWDSRGWRSCLGFAVLLAHLRVRDAGHDADADCRLMARDETSGLSSVASGTNFI